MTKRRSLLEAVGDDQIVLYGQSDLLCHFGYVEGIQHISLLCPRAVMGVCKMQCARCEYVAWCLQGVRTSPGYLSGPTTNLFECTIPISIGRFCLFL